MPIVKETLVTSPLGATLTNSTLKLSRVFDGFEIRVVTRETPGKDPEARVFITPPPGHLFAGLAFYSLDSGNGPFIRVPANGLVSENSPIIWVQTPDKLSWGRGEIFASHEEYLNFRQRQPTQEE